MNFFFFVVFSFTNATDFVNYHGLEGFKTDSSDSCRLFTQNAMEMKLAQGFLTIPDKNGIGVFCFPISRAVSRIRRYRTEILDSSRHYRYKFKFN